MASSVTKRLEGKTILITGASSGIGRSTAFEFARTCPHNLKMILTARRIDSLKEIATAIADEVGDGVHILPIRLDISNADEVRGFVGRLPAPFRQIHVLVNNAYVSPVLDQPESVQVVSLPAGRIGLDQRIRRMPHEKARD